MKQEADLIHGPIASRMVLFALPLAAGSILQQLFNAADVSVVGHFVGSDALAAVGANAPIVNFLVNLFLGLSVGTNIVISLLIGRKDEERISRAVHTSLLLSFYCGIFLAFLGVSLARPLLTLISTPAEILDPAVLYLRLYFLGMPFTMLYNFSAAILRSRGDTRRPFAALLVSGGVNVLLNLLFVLVFHRGVDGVAIATVLANALSAAILLVLLAKESGSFRLHLSQLRIDPMLLKQIVSMGLPAGLQTSMFSIANIIIQSALNSLGSTYIAGSSVALNYEYFSFYMLNGFAQAAVTFTGQNFGAGNRKRCQYTLAWALGLGIAGTLLLDLVFLLFASGFAGLFSADPSVIAAAVSRMFRILPFECFNAAIEIIAGMLRGMGKAALPTAICAVGICLLRIVWVNTAFVRTPTFSVLMTAYPVSWIFTSAILLVTVLWQLNKMKKT